VQLRRLSPLLINCSTNSPVRMSVGKLKLRALKLSCPVFQLMRSSPVLTSLILVKRTKLSESRNSGSGVLPSRFKITPSESSCQVIQRCSLGRRKDYLLILYQWRMRSWSRTLKELHWLLTLQLRHLNGSSQILRKLMTMLRFWITKTPSSTPPSNCPLDSVKCSSFKRLTE